MDLHLENLHYDIKDRVAIITIDRPKVLNALNDSAVAELGSLCLSLQEDSAVGVVILTGAGEKAFVAGADINELTGQDAAAGVQRALKGQNVFQLIESLGKPVIAAVNGFALGGGCELALACSVRLASSNARFGLPEVKLGIIPGYGGTQRLPRLVGKGVAMEMLLTGEMIDAQEAFRIGLVNRVVSPEDLMPTAEFMARKMLANGPVALKYCMTAVHHGLEVSEREGLQLEATLFGLACATADMREGTQAFLEKRPAQFKGC
jgi:enoyl-CoA hydratase